MNQNQPALSGDSALVSEVIKTRAPKLLARGFEFTGTTLEGSSKLGQFPVFHFLHKKSGLRLSISFSPAEQDLNGGFIVLITKPVNRRLDVEDFLKRKGRTSVEPFFTYRNGGTDVRRFAEALLDVLDSAFDTELKPVLEGKTFEETPIDWGGYR